MTVSDAAVATETSVRVFPLEFDVRYRAASSPGLALLRWPLGLVYGVVSIVPAVIAWLAFTLAWLAVVLTGRMPRSLFDILQRTLGWYANYLCFSFLLHDRFSPFATWSPDFRLAVEYPERSSRLLAFARLFTAFPGLFALLGVSLVQIPLLVVSWFSVVLTGRHPEGLFWFHEGVIRWTLRMFAYLLLLRDEYPPYSMEPDAAASSNLVAFFVTISFFGNVVAPLVGVTDALKNLLGSRDRRMIERLAAEDE